MSPVPIGRSIYRDFPLKRSGHSRAAGSSPQIRFRTDPGMAVLRWFVQQPGEPEAFKDPFEPLYANYGGEQRNGLLPMDGETNVRRSLNQDVKQGRSATWWRKVETTSLAR